jgi:pimeloyl-ACP methyl ester carboxylesterase
MLSETGNTMSRLSCIFLVLSSALLGCTSLENMLVFQPEPGARTYAPPPQPIEDMDLLMPDGTKVRARWAPHPQATGAVLYCHGNGGNVEQWGPSVREIWENLGESVLIFDYPGYGYSQGKPSEQGCYDAAWTAYQWLTQTRKIPAGRIVIMGESLGGAVAIDLASRFQVTITPNPPPLDYRALILVRTFTSVPDVADDQFPLLFSAPLLSNQFDSLKKIPLCKQPVFIAQADKDRTIPFRHGQRLAQACYAPSELYVLRGMGHNDPLPPDFYVALKQFLVKVPPR